MKTVTLAILAIICSSVTKAQIVYTDLIPDQTYTSGNHDIDINNDGIPDFTFIMTTTPVTNGCSCHGPARADDTLAIEPLGVNEVGIYNGSSKLDYQNWIDAGTLQWTQNMKLMARLMWTNFHCVKPPELPEYCAATAYNSGDWYLLVQNKYLGVSIVVDSEIYFGWIRLDVSFPHSFTIKDYAFNSTPIQSILAGDTTAPYGCPTSNIVISDQSLVDNFSAIYPGCSEISGNLKINGDNISNLNGLSGLTFIGGDLNIYQNSSLVNLSGLEGLTSVGGDLIIEDNSNITTLAGLDNLASIAGGLYIESNPDLENVMGMYHITSIGGSLFLVYNPALNDLTGLQNLTSIGGNLNIVNNPALTTVSGLENINASSINSLSIHNNGALSKCDIQSICDYLAVPGAEFTIYDNGTGCENQQEVEAACEALGVTDNSIIKNFSVFPNPSTGRFTIDFTLVNGSEANLLVFNSLGQVVSTLIDGTVIPGRHELSWNAEGLPDGLYYYKLLAGNQVERGTMSVLK